jgi:hypothetical protein
MVLTEQPDEVIPYHVACIRVHLLVTLPPSKAKSYQLLNNQ